MMSSDSPPRVPSGMSASRVAPERENAPGGAQASSSAKGLVGRQAFEDAKFAQNQDAKLKMIQR